MKHSYMIAAIFLYIVVASCPARDEGVVALQQQKSIKDQMLTIVKDYKAINGDSILRLLPVSSVHHSFYWLPESVDPIISSGKASVPMLIELKNSGRALDQFLATACINIINAKKFHTGGRKKDVKSGMFEVQYIISSF